MVPPGTTIPKLPLPQAKAAPRSTTNLSFTLGNNNQIADAEKLQQQVITVGRAFLVRNTPMS
jgi:hypothetical protein